MPQIPADSTQQWTIFDAYTFPTCVWSPAFSFCHWLRCALSSQRSFSWTVCIRPEIRHRREWGWGSHEDSLYGPAQECCTFFHLFTSEYPLPYMCVCVFMFIFSVSGCFFSIETVTQQPFHLPSTSHILPLTSVYMSLYKREWFYSRKNFLYYFPLEKCTRFLKDLINCNYFLVYFLFAFPTELWISW